MLRFYLVQLAPTFELYASPVNFDPESPMFPISSPPEYARQLEATLGTFYTTGMAEDHNGLLNGRFDETAYLAQCEGVLRERQAMLRHELARFREGLLFCLFDTPDRVAHCFWRFRDPTHPANEGQPVAGMERVIEEHYRACDALLGDVFEHADDQTLVVALSDHGMCSFRRGFHLNTWLYEQGLLALKDGVTPGEAAGDFFRGVDWERTKAYGLGLGGIYLNLHGREAHGVVKEGEVEAVKAAISDGLTGLRDPQTDSVAILRVSSREEMYSGPYAAEGPDLMVNCAEGYRISWATPLGGLGEGLFEDNHRKWSGDHAVDPTLVPGVLFANRPIRDGGNLADLAPTLLSALGVPKGQAMEGESVLI
jgi:predicted AlkP superfamily phosphohydrolase/phosphomutase